MITLYIAKDLILIHILFIYFAKQLSVIFTYLYSNQSYLHNYRWAQLLLQLDEIERNVSMLLSEEEDVKYQNHLGGGVYASVTSHFYCVDFRRFFLPRGTTTAKPTRRGVALRISEFKQLHNVIASINTDFPELASAIPCYLQQDHNSQETVAVCRECCQF